MQKQFCSMGSASTDKFIDLSVVPKTAYKAVFATTGRALSVVVRGGLLHYEGFMFNFWTKNCGT